MDLNNIGWRKMDFIEGDLCLHILKQIYTMYIPSTVYMYS